MIKNIFTLFLIVTFLLIFLPIYAIVKMFEDTSGKKEAYYPSDYFHR